MGTIWPLEYSILRAVNSSIFCTYGKSNNAAVHLWLHDCGQHPNQLMPGSSAPKGTKFPTRWVSLEVTMCMMSRLQPLVDAGHES